MKKILSVFLFVTVVGLLFVGNTTCYAADNNLINIISYGDNITAELYDTDEDGKADYLKLVGFGKMKDMNLESYYDSEDGEEYVRGPLSDYDDTIRKIDIDERITSIGNYVFYGCDKVEKIKLPNSISKIGNGAFNCCLSLNEIEIPYGVLSIGEDAFGYCESLSNVVIPSSVVTIGDYAFLNCKALTSLVIPSSVVTMGTDVFNSCSSLGSVSFSAGMTSIPASTFRWCESLTSVTIPSSVEYIDEDAFLMESKVKNIYYIGDKTEYSSMNIYDNNNGIAESNIYYVTNEWKNDYSECSLKMISINSDGDEYIENFSAKVLSILIKEPTCSSEGVSYSLATHGGYMFCSPEISISTIAHDWDEGKVESEATCNKEGVFVKSCRKCGEIEKTTLEKINHKFVWKLEKEAAVGETGSKHEECCICGYKKVSIEIPALEQEKKQGDVVDNSTEIKAVKQTKAKITKAENKKGKKISLKLSGMIEGSGYEVQYGTKSNFKSAKTVKKSSSSVTISKLKKGNKYYIRVRIYKKIGNKIYYGKWSSKKTIKIKK